MVMIARPPKEIGSFQDRKFRELLSRLNGSVTDLQDLTLLLYDPAPGTLPNAKQLIGSSDISLSLVGSTLIINLGSTGVAAGTFTKVTVDSKGRITSASAATTADITEATNLYFTNARARGALSGTANQINYNSSTGVISAPQDIHSGASPTFVTAILSALTSGRIPIVTSGGQITDSASLTFDGTTLKSPKVALQAGTSTGNIAKAGGVIFDYFADAGNSTTTETDLYSSSVPANALAVNGDKLSVQYGGVFVSSGTATRQIKLYFGGSVIFDTGALTLSLSSAWTLFATIVRKDSATVRYLISLTTEGAALPAYTAVGELGSLTLSNAQTLKITGQAAGVGAATNDIVAKLGTVEWKSAA